MPLSSQFMILNQREIEKEKHNVCRCHHSHLKEKQIDMVAIRGDGWVSYAQNHPFNIWHPFHVDVKGIFLEQQRNSDKGNKVVLLTKQKTIESCFFFITRNHGTISN